MHLWSTFAKCCCVVGDYKRFWSRDRELCTISLNHEFANAATPRAQSLCVRLIFRSCPGDNTSFNVSKQQTGGFGLHMTAQTPRPLDIFCVWIGCVSCAKLCLVRSNDQLDLRWPIIMRTMQMHAVDFKRVAIAVSRFRHLRFGKMIHCEIPCIGRNWYKIVIQLNCITIESKINF